LSNSSSWYTEHSSQPDHEPGLPIRASSISSATEAISRSGGQPGVVSTAILNTGIIPEPNSSFGCNTTNPTGLPKCYVASVSPSTYWREELFRIDHLVTPSQQLSFRYVHDSWNTTTLTPQWGVVQNSFPTVENRLNGPGLNMKSALRARFRTTSSTALPSVTPWSTSLYRPRTAGSHELISSRRLDDMGYIFNNGFNNDRLPGLMFQETTRNMEAMVSPWTPAMPLGARQSDVHCKDDASRVLGNYSLQFASMQPLSTE